MSTKTIDEVLALHNDSLLAMRGVVGTAIGLYQGRPCIRVLLGDSSRLRAAERSIPAAIEGFSVRVEVTGRIRPRADR